MQNSARQKETQRQPIELDVQKVSKPRGSVLESAHASRQYSNGRDEEQEGSPRSRRSNRSGSSLQRLNTQLSEVRKRSNSRKDHNSQQDRSEENASAQFELPA